MARCSCFASHKRSRPSTCAALFLLAAFSFFGVYANAAQVTMTITGTFSQGTDVSGFFFTPQTNLIGKSYTIVFEMDDTQGVPIYGTWPADCDNGLQNSGLNTPVPHAVLTVNGKSYTFGVYPTTSISSYVYSFNATSPQTQLSARIDQSRFDFADQSLWGSESAAVNIYLNSIYKCRSWESEFPGGTMGSSYTLVPGKDTYDGEVFAQYSNLNNGEVFVYFTASINVETVNVSGPIVPPVALTIVNPPEDFSYTLSEDNYRATPPIQFIARSSDASTPISWTVDLTYTTSGGVGPLKASLSPFTTTSGLANNAQIQKIGGQANISVTQGTATASEMGTVSGSQIPDPLITARLTSLYAPTFNGYTHQLLCQIAKLESSYRQFTSMSLNGVRALWPVESPKAKRTDGSILPAGSYIGLMQVPTSMTSAFDWYDNTQEGAATFNDKIVAVLHYQNAQMQRVQHLPAMLGEQIEDSALLFYNGFTVHYYIPGTVNEKPAWILNPSDGLPTKKGTPANYVKTVREQTVPQ